MKSLSIKLSNYLLRMNIIERSAVSLYQFGIQILLEVLSNIAMSVIIAISLKMIPECILFYIVFIPLRKYAGGYHSNNFINCFLLSNISLTIFLLFVKVINISFIYSAAIYLVAILAIKMLKFAIDINRVPDECEQEYFEKKLDRTLIKITLLQLIFTACGLHQYFTIVTTVMCFMVIVMLTGKWKYQFCLRNQQSTLG